MINIDKNKIISIYTFHLDIQETNEISTMGDLQSSDAENSPEDSSIESEKMLYLFITSSNTLPKNIDFIEKNIIESS